METLNREAVKMLHLLGNTTVTRVSTTIGPEQEYFLVDKALYDRRKDLIYCGRTLFGAPAPKGQEMEDHYFGTLKPRVSAFMHDLDMGCGSLAFLQNQAQRSSACAGTSWLRSLIPPISQ